ncbi:transcriptional regulator BetI [Vibrio penaeicida]|uniref:HTH-type transcriptional regulator BetI n=1 Tax=Vibrio penaeicida TaxID=104609 RepID=A0AAV5NZ73_9VIBR|nr:transcriptional regulator BetI [Vibrio penaeicida]RTZ22669.1 transcriptional regulator BetI [Vibrio penaeicida]GLQ75663.1 HTH-type transcriptional regulator BetI [Vibrio penaeicida]
MPKIGMPEIRKPQLIDATMTVIDRVGMQSASVALISEAAGVSPAIINHYFGGKNGLLEATMRQVLQLLAEGVKERLSDIHESDVLGRVMAIVGGNFDHRQVERRIVKTWLAFWPHAMHNPMLFRLQRINEQRLVSHLVYELKKVLPKEKAKMVAMTTASLIDGIWLRGALNPKGIDAEFAQQLITEYLFSQLPEALLTDKQFFTHTKKGTLQ